MVKTRSRALRRLSRPAADDGLKVYCVGIGGVGLSGLARVALQLGHSVAGSDRRSSRATLKLSEKGAQIQFKQDGEAIHERLDLVVASAAIPATHPEIERARGFDIPVVKYSEALGAIFRTRQGIAISGTHGKTTTTSMTSFILHDCGLDPSYVVGGQVPQLRGSAAFGQGPDMVVEACEYDRSFLRLEPSTTVILNIEEDHFDCFEDLDAILEVFAEFATQIKPGGTLIACDECPNARALARALETQRHDLKVLRYGFKAEADVQAIDIQVDDGLTSFTVKVEGQIVGRVSLQLPGEHMVLNALAAATSAHSTGLDWDQILASLSNFQGVQRRFTILHDGMSGSVIDDYAHHPTAIAAVIKAARSRFEDRRVVAVFEPHQHNRTLALFEDFKDSLALADQVVVTDIYRCRDADEDVQAVDGSILAKAVADLAPDTQARHAAGQDDVLTCLAEIVRPGDSVLFMGAGRITETAHRFAAWRSRTMSRPFKRPKLSLLSETQEKPGQEFLWPPGRTVEDIVKRELGPILRLDEPLARHVTFRAGGQARFFLSPPNVDVAVEAVALLRRLGVPFHILGGGSNSLYRDGEFPGAVISTKSMRRLETQGDGLIADSGVWLQKVLHFAEKQGFGGIESLAGIPATMGGAVAMNAGGAPGAPAVGDYVQRLLVLEPDGHVHWISAKEAGFRYRHSELKERFVLAVEMGGFEDLDPKMIRAGRFAAARRKAEVQPLSSASAGCIFQNPANDSAGRLIDQLGMKGLAVGGAQVSTHHANFIVNSQGASADEILRLIELVRLRVLEHTGQELKLELQIKS